MDNFEFQQGASFLEKILFVARNTWFSDTCKLFQDKTVIIYLKLATLISETVFFFSSHVLNFQAVRLQCSLVHKSIFNYFFLSAVGSDHKLVQFYENSDTQIISTLRDRKIRGYGCLEMDHYVLGEGGTIFFLTFQTFKLCVIYFGGR